MASGIRLTAQERQVALSSYRSRGSARVARRAHVLLKAAQVLRHVGGRSIAIFDAWL